MTLGRGEHLVTQPFSKELGLDLMDGSIRECHPQIDSVDGEGMWGANREAGRPVRESNGGEYLSDGRDVKR